MQWFKAVCARFMMSILVSFGYVLAFTAFRVNPSELTVTPGEKIEFSVMTNLELHDTQTTYQRYIDGEPINGIQTE